MKKSTYLWLQIKRAAKIYPSVLTVTVITLLSIALAAGMILNNSANSEDKMKMKIGVVGDVSESYLGIGIYALKNMDSSRFAIDFIEMNEEDARAALENREITGYVQVPDNYVNNIAYGENVPANYVTLNAPESFGTVVTSEITQTVSGYVTESQNSMNSIYEIGRKVKKQNLVNREIDNIALLYLDQILSRNETYHVNIIGVADSISMGGYYICGVMMFFMLIWGISCNKILLKKNYAMPRALKARGIKTTSQVLCEYAGFFVFTFITFLLFAIVFGIVAGNNDFGIRELGGADFMSCIIFIFKAIPVIAMITAMQMLIYELVLGTVNAILLQFLIAVALAYVSGCFYPNNFFPESIQNIADILPSGVGFSYLRKSMTGLSVGAEFIKSGLYTVVFMALAVIIRQYRMAGDEQ